MKRSAVVKRLKRFHYKWRGCTFDYKMCSELLGIVEKCEPTLYNSWDWSTYKQTKSNKKSTYK